MAYNTPESVADYLSRFQMQVTERTKGTFSPMHVKYSLALKMGSSSFETTFQSNPNVHGEPTVTQVFGALASDAMLARDYGMDEFDGLLEGCKGDIYKMVQMAQYECFKSDLYDHREDKAAWSSAAPFPVTIRVRTATPSQGKQGMLPPPAMV